MRVSVFVGDLADAEADALCTSTNPRLTLVMGTGAAVRARGGFAVLRACEASVAQELERTGKHGLPDGSAHVTTAGELPHRRIIHCVASNAEHRSSPEIVAACVRNALAAAAAEGCRSIAIPVFGTGHARVRFDVAVRTIAETLRASTFDGAIVMVTNDDERAEEARAILETALGTSVQVTRSAAMEPEALSLWGTYETSA
jgi:O-acetyl-ADP-ribose deacetylase (regulator of RNase III)